MKSAVIHAISTMAGSERGSRSREKELYTWIVTGSHRLKK